jgi:hypothetical protein
MMAQPKRRSIGLLSKPSLPEVDLEKGALSSRTRNSTIGTFRKNDISDPEAGDLPGMPVFPVGTKAPQTDECVAASGPGDNPRLSMSPTFRRFR